MATDEKVLNGFIAKAMERVAPPGFLIQPEQHGKALEGHSSPDIIVHMPYQLRIIIETEYGNPALSDAIDRLGYEFKDSSALPLRNVLAVGIPDYLGDLPVSEIDGVLDSNQPRFLMQVVSGSGEENQDVEVTPTLPISVELKDLVQYAWLASIPQPYTAAVLDDVVGKLTAVQRELAAEIDQYDSEIKEKLVRIYGGTGRYVVRTQDGEDTALVQKLGTPSDAMMGVAGNAVGTLASMVQLHLNVKAPGSNMPDVTPLSSPGLWQRSSPHDALTDEVARAWRAIERQDYKPLSTLAADLLEDEILSPLLGRTLRTIYTTIRDSVTSGISATTNVAAEIWQAMIPDRNQRAAYYTKPITAELLANLTTARLAEPGEARYNEICAGTGTLARATEENIRFRHYAMKPQNPSAKVSIHNRRMSRRVLLTDVNQQSVTVATANMASLEPQTQYDTSAIFAITSEGGSLNFLKDQGVSDLGNLMVGSDGGRGDMLTLSGLDADICNNNDPYFRAGAEAGDRNPISETAMQEYRRLANKRLPGVANGTAGLATFMHVIEHELLVDCGVHGKVLPLSAAHTVSYQGLRRNLENDYRDVIVISTSAGTGESMSQDTSIQEMLVIGTKTAAGQGDCSVMCVNLTKGFESKYQAKMYADAIRSAAESEGESGDIVVGTTVGTWTKMSKLGDGAPWNLVGIAGEFATLAFQASRGHAWDPRTHRSTPYELPMTTLGKVVGIGIADARIGRAEGSRSPRGAFVVHPLTGPSVPGVPSLWIADSLTQDSMTCEPTHYCTSKGDAEKAAEVLESVSRFHISADLRVSSQAIAAAYTEEKALGGSGWISMITDLEGLGEAVTLFLNSTLGLIPRIVYGQSAHVGRARFGIRGAANLPVPEFNQDSETGRHARRVALATFEELRLLRLNRISLSAIDDNRIAVDRVVSEMLGIELDRTNMAMVDAWRRMMCSQTAVHANVHGTVEQLTAAGVLRSFSEPNTAEGSLSLL